MVKHISVMSCISMIKSRREFTDVLKSFFRILFKNPGQKSWSKIMVSGVRFRDGGSDIMKTKN